MSERNHFIEGVVFGVAIGALAGILFAPRSCAETSKNLKKIKDNPGPLLQNAKEKTEEKISQTINAIETGFDRIGKMIDKKQPNNQFEGYTG